MSDYKILKTESSKGYELLDSGEGEKLERYGDAVVSRPDPQALWRKNLSEKEWEKANAYFKRTASVADVRKGEDSNWSTRGDVSERWPIDFGGLKFWIKLSAFKHTGLFPEHASSWEWIREQIKNKKAKNNNGEVKVLNLFGYTGGATLAAAQAGAEVVHVDGSKAAIGWGRDNAELSGLGDKPIRWILDDAVKFVQREIKRGNKYHGIIMDPPAFGHGPNKELWRIESSFLFLLDLCKQILADDAAFVLVNGYASGYSAIAYQNSLSDLMKDKGGKVEIGEITIEETVAKRLLPCGIFARWSK